MIPRLLNMNEKTRGRRHLWPNLSYCPVIRLERLSLTAKIPESGYPISWAEILNWDHPSMKQECYLLYRDVGWNYVLTIFAHTTKLHDGTVFNSQHSKGMNCARESHRNILLIRKNKYQIWKINSLFLYEKWMFVTSGMCQVEPQNFYQSRTATPIEDFRDFPKSLQKIIKQCLEIVYDWFLPQSFHQTLHNLVRW
jgi:hypothetical protein